MKNTDLLNSRTKSWRFGQKNKTGPCIVLYLEVWVQGWIRWSPNSFIWPALRALEANFELPQRSHQLQKCSNEVITTTIEPSKECNRISADCETIDGDLGCYVVSSSEKKYFSGRVALY